MKYLQLGMIRSEAKYTSTPTGGGDELSTEHAVEGEEVEYEWMLERGGRRGSIHTLYLYTTETPSSVKSKKEKRMGGCELFAWMGALLIEE